MSNHSVNSTFNIQHLTFAFSVSNPRQPGLDSRVSLLGGPEVHRQRDEIVDGRNGSRIEAQIDRLHIPPTRLARLDAYRLVRVTLEVRKLVGILFAAGGAADPIETPFQPAQ